MIVNGFISFPEQKEEVEKKSSAHIENDFVRV